MAGLNFGPSNNLMNRFSMGPNFGKMAPRISPMMGNMGMPVRLNQFNRTNPMQGNMGQINMAPRFPIGGYRPSSGPMQQPPIQNQQMGQSMGIGGGGLWNRYGNFSKNPNIRY